jgi:hypothetical protein
MHHYNPSSAGVDPEGTLLVSLPLTFRKEGLVERHQVEGTDPSARYFNRSVQVMRTAQAYQAKMLYEALTVEGRPSPTIPGAVKTVVEKLHELGFTRLRTRPNFKGKRYLAEKETWVDYPDPADPGAPA